MTRSTTGLPEELDAYLNDHVTDVDADPVDDPLVRGYRGGPLDHHLMKAAQRE